MLDNLSLKHGSVSFKKSQRTHSSRRERTISFVSFITGVVVSHLMFSAGSFLNANQTPYQHHKSSTLNLTQHAHESSPISIEPLKFCDDTSKHSGPCIFDIGHNNGQDTRNYLNDYPSSRVVAIEANPTLLNQSKIKFSNAITSERLKLVGIGLVEAKYALQENKEKLKFFVNRNDKFSSFEEGLGCRNYKGEVPKPGDHTFCRVMELETKTCSDLIHEYGTPAYMKIDIEGKDRACLQALALVKPEERPKYVSIENVQEYDINILLNLGYSKFKVVNQNLLQVGTTQEEEGHSGPWGEDTVDMFVGKNWQTAGRLKSRLPLPRKMMLKGTQRTAWYDLHASM